jgi:hypothetical protein
METSDSGRLQELRKSPSPIASPLKVSAKSMIVSLHKAWKICLRMDKQGESQHKIGWAFYVALKDLFSNKKN